MVEQADSAIAALSSLVAPGGKLVVGELDGHGLFHHPLPDDVADGLNVLASARNGAFDPFAGRKLFHRLHRAGLRDICVHLLPYHFSAGSAPQSAVEQGRMKFTILGPRVSEHVGGRETYDRWVARFLEMLEDPSVFTYSVLFLVEGTVSQD